MEPIAVVPATTYNGNDVEERRKRLSISFDVLTKIDPVFEAELNRFRDLEWTTRYANMLDIGLIRVLYPTIKTDKRAAVKKGIEYKKVMIIERMDELMLRVANRSSAIDEWAKEAISLYDAPGLEIHNNVTFKLGNMPSDVRQQVRYLADARAGFVENLRYLETTRETLLDTFNDDLKRHGITYEDLNAAEWNTDEENVE